MQKKSQHIHILYIRKKKRNKQNVEQKYKIFLKIYYRKKKAFRHYVKVVFGTLFSNVFYTLRSHLMCKFMNHQQQHFGSNFDPVNKYSNSNTTLMGDSLL